MKKIILLLLTLYITSFSFSQSTLFWREEANNGNWNVGNNWWNGTSTQSLPGGEIIRIGNNNQLTMSNNASSSNRFQLFLMLEQQATELLLAIL